MIELALLVLFLGFGLPAALAASIGAVMIVAYLSFAVLALMLHFWYVILIVMLIMIAPILYLDGWLLPILGIIAATVAGLTFYGYLLDKADKQKSAIEQKE